MGLKMNECFQAFCQFRNTKAENTAKLRHCFAAGNNASHTLDGIPTSKLTKNQDDFPGGELWWRIGLGLPLARSDRPVELIFNAAPQQGLDEGA